MLISYKHKFLFVHIFKTAGTSVTEALIPYARPIDRLAYGFWPTRKMTNALNWILNNQFNEFLTGFHKHARAVDAQKKLAREVFDSLFKFAFVRNPWDWQVSLYFYIRQAPKHKLHEKLNKMGFTDFIQWHIEQKPLRQIDFLADEESRMIVDFVGKYENLDNDLNHIRKQLSLKVGPLHKTNVSKNRAHKDYRKYYDSSTANLIAAYFEADIKHFGYEFE